MDPGVLEAMRRWPNVPAVYGWLSLTPRGEWRLHPMGDAMRGGYGEGISNEQILSFINRNYLADDAGCWFFQNGPQRVFVRIDAAPLILRMRANDGQILTHCGHPIQQVRHWWTDEVGRLFAQTDAGPGMVDDRDLMQLGEALQNTQGNNLLDLLEAELPSQESVTASLSADLPSDAPSRPARQMISEMSDPTGLFAALRQPATLELVDSSQIPSRLGFVSNPAPASTHQSSQALE